MSNEIPLPIKSFSLGGYRSFGKQTQYFEKFNKINLFIGQNNSGKSNVLRFLHNIYPNLNHLSEIKLEALDKPIPNFSPLIIGLPQSLKKDENGDFRDFVNNVEPLFNEGNQRTFVSGDILRLFLHKAEMDEKQDAWFNFQINGRALEANEDNWKEAFEMLNDKTLSMVWAKLTRKGGGSRNHWYPETLKAISPKFNTVHTVMIPAIRQIGKQGSESDDYSGEGIIERLVKLQNPDVLSQSDKSKFEKINNFLQTVTDNSSATIEIPYERDTILVHMDGKTLPLDSLGTGIHEVIIIAAAATILDNTVICVEEPEIHLNPLLQKKLVRYLSDSTNNQYFIATHSAALMDTPNSEIYHLELYDGESIVERVTSDKKRSLVCEDLGYRPSDLFQSNCIIWVEGPSDRIYLNYWIKTKEPKLIEGIHYSIMFYGGRLASHLSAKEPDEIVEDFITLRRLNRRGVIMIDSDKNKKGAKINKTKIRLKDEFDSGPGYAWVTDGREIENYLPQDQIEDAIKNIHPSSSSLNKFEKFDNTLKIQTRTGKEESASKVKVARYITENYELENSVLDLSTQLKKLIQFINESNF